MTVVLTNPKATQSGGVLTVTELDGAPLVTNVSTLRLSNGTVADNLDGSVNLTVGSGTGTGDVSGPASSIDGEVVLFSGTSGKNLKRSNLTGIIKAVSGIQQVATPGTDYLVPPFGHSDSKSVEWFSLNSGRKWHGLSGSRNDRVRRYSLRGSFGSTVAVSG